MKGILAIVLVCTSVSAFAQISFYKQFSNNGYDYGEGIVQTEDSSYLITGSSSSFSEAPAQAFLMKLDSLGNFKWSRNYGGDESEGGQRVMYIQNDGIFIAGYTNSFGNGAYDFYLTKTDTDGNQLWEKTYGSISWDKVHDAALTRDSGVILVGETLNTLDGESDIYIVRTDKNGNELWSQQIGGLGADLAKCIQPIDDSTFVIGGGVFVADSNVQKALAMKIEDNGTIWWKDTLGTVGSYIVNDIALETNRICYVGMQIKPTGDTADFYLKTDFVGTFDFEFNLSNPGKEYAVGIAPFGVNRFVLATEFDNQYSYGQTDVAFHQFYSGLYFESSLAGVNNIGIELLGQLIPTSDKGAIAVGRLTQAGMGGSDVYVIKLYPGAAIINSNDFNTTQPLVSIIENEIQHDLFRVYPNPAEKIVNVDFTNSNLQGDIMLYNQLGQMVFSQSINGFQNHAIDLSNLDSGLYRIVITSNEMISSKALLIK